MASDRAPEALKLHAGCSFCFWHILEILWRTNELDGDRHQAHSSPLAQ